MNVVIPRAERAAPESRSRCSGNGIRTGHRDRALEVRSVVAARASCRVLFEHDDQQLEFLDEAEPFAPFRRNEPTSLRWILKSSWEEGACHSGLRT
jgi:hypothetical protein